MENLSPHNANRASAQGPETPGDTVLAIVADADSASVAIVQQRRCVLELSAGAVQPGLRHTPRASHQLPALAAAALQRMGLRAAQVHRFAVANGPAAFTSLRVSIALCQGLAWAADRPVIAIAHLQAMAFASVLDGGAPGRIGVLADARMNECWVAVYEVEQSPVEESRWPRTLMEPALLDAAGVDCLLAEDALKVESWVCGPGVDPRLAERAAAVGAQRHATMPGEAMSQRDAVVQGGPWTSGRAVIRAGAVATLAALAGPEHAVAAEALQPLYLRDRIALDVDEQRALRAARARA